MAETHIVAEPGVQTIEITREFDAPPELVFRAHTEPDLLVQWLGPRQYTLRVDRYEVRDGGTWRYVHQDADGTEYGFHGVFHGTPSVDGVVQTFEWEGAPGHVALERLTFEPVDGGNRTRIRTLSVYQSVADRDAMVAGGMEDGLNEAHERLDELLANQTATR